MSKGYIFMRILKSSPIKKSIKTTKIREMRTPHLIVYVLFLWSSFSAQAANPQSLFKNFQESEILDITIRTDFEYILADKKNEDYQDASLSYKKDGELVDWDLKVRQRGKFRRRSCEMPPLKLNFSKKKLEGAGFKPFDKMKLVTYCINDDASYDNVLKEYLAYKMYNELTPYSFQVQLVRVTYIDTKKSMRKIKRYGFLIESTSELEARIGLQKVEMLSIAPEKLHLKQEGLVAEFQYLIGNADWNLASMHNLKLLKKSATSPVILVPYDFDFSGLVDAPYALPNNNVGQRSIKQRVYIGQYPNERSNIQGYLAAKRADLYAIISDFKFLDWTIQGEMKGYLDRYFEASPESVEVSQPAFGK